MTNEEKAREIARFNREFYDEGGANQKYSEEECYDSALEMAEWKDEQKPIVNISLRDVILSIWDLEEEWEELTKCSSLTEYGTKLDFIQKHWNERESLRRIAWIETTNEKDK